MKHVSAHLLSAPLVLGLLSILPCSLSANELVIEEVIVTAQKRAQSVQDVGIAISVMGADEVADRDLGEFDSLAGAIPNLQALDEAAGLPSFRIRGIGLNEFQAAFDSPVGVHVDEVFLSKPMLGSMGFFDVERVEVLKGPQGTVFGRNTVGGAVNYYSAAPTEVFEGGIKVGVERYQRASAEAHISGPLNDSLRARLAVKALDHGDDGPYRNLFSNNDLGELEQQQVRAQLAWSGAGTNVTFAVEYGSKEGDLTPYDNLFQDTPGGLPDVSREIRNPISRFTVNQDYFPTTDSETLSAALRVEHETGAGTLTSLTAFKGFERDNREDSDNTPIVSTNIDWYSEIDQFTQEFRLSGERDNWIYLVGAYFERDKLTTVETLDVADLFALGLTAFAQLGSDHEVDTESVAIFTSHEFALTDRLSLIVGARYTDEENEIEGQSFITAAPSPTTGNENRVPAANRIILVDADTNREDDDFNVKAGLNFYPGDNLLLYGSVSTGFRSGGYDLAFGSPSLESFEPEDVLAFEAGVKSTLADGRITLNANAFFTEVEDYQSNVNLAGELVPRRRNVGTLETYGFESELQWLVNEAVELRWSLGYTNAEITDVATDINGNEFQIDGVPIKGNQPVNTPEWSSSLLLDVSWPLNDTLVLDFLAGITWNDERFLEIENGADHLVDAYTTVDASLSIGAADRKWRATLWGRNITDEDYLRYINDVPAFGLFLTINAEPSTFGVTFEYSF